MTAENLNIALAPPSQMREIEQRQSQARAALKQLAVDHHLSIYVRDQDFVSHADEPHLGITPMGYYLHIPLVMMLSGLWPRNYAEQNQYLRIIAYTISASSMSIMCNEGRSLVTGVSLLGETLDDLAQVNTLLKGNTLTIHQRRFDEHGRVVTDANVWVKLTLRSSDPTLTGSYVGFESLVLQCLDPIEPASRKVVLDQLVDLCRLRFFSEAKSGSRDQERLLRELVRSGFDTVAARPTISTYLMAGERVYRRLV